ncbi:SDR family oxidoreductase [Portibacter marinus]|uniref:SDR family oxidoreductase n=1 Tax=Portibacter marinus TaxID=2898660 RepID=UPI001F366200|nr:SDR family oxidoreductase [Portibacter marinus]
MEKILIAGANGSTGRKITNLLKDSEAYHPIAMIRKSDQKSHFHELNVETVLADLTNDLSPLPGDIDKVIFAAGSGGEAVVEVDQEGAKKLIDWSRKNGISKFVMLSSIGADEPEKADQLQEYLKAKHNADEYLKQSGLPYTIVRPGSLTDEGGLNYIKLEKHLEEMGEISRADVAKTLVECLSDSIGKEQTFEIIKGDTQIEEALDKVTSK